MKYITLVATIALLTLAACAGTGAQHQPVLSAAPGPGYDDDLDQCRTLARSQDIWNPETRSKATIGAAIGALAGLGDDAVSNGEGALTGAVVGAAAGATAGAVDMRNTRRDVLIECLRDHGHPVAG